MFYDIKLLFGILHEGIPSHISMAQLYVIYI